MTIEERKEMQQKANEVMAKIGDLLKERNLQMQTTIMFKESKSVPLLSKICLWILNLQGGKFDFIFGPDRAVQKDANK